MMTMLPIPKMETQFGKLYEADCLSILPQISAATVDLVFADPPFNLGKEYNSKFDDAVPDGIIFCGVNNGWMNLCEFCDPAGLCFFSICQNGTYRLELFLAKN